MATRCLRSLGGPPALREAEASPPKRRASDTVCKGLDTFDRPVTLFLGTQLVPSRGV